mmetsp:Transcript_95294/g.172006  ORF Transcript_95294/g.172006 Transcript_95294/m.172006 type:complete len:355 (+) Transcript_95294:163-1227(+)
MSFRPQFTEFQAPPNLEAGFLNYGGAGGLGRKIEARNRFFEGHLKHLNESTKKADVAALVFMPWVCFVAVMCPFALFFWTVNFLPWNVLAASTVFGLLMFFWPNVHRVQNSLYFRVLGASCLVSTLMGMSLGLYDHIKYTSFYRAYGISPSFNDILPTAVPGAYQDASVIQFSKDAKIDVTMSLGYNNGEVYCVAPIFDGATYATVNAGTSVGFWAVGVDCCSGRGHFQCGPVWNENVHGGLAITRQGQTPLLDLATFRVAAQAAALSSNLVVPLDAVFVKWSSQPTELIDEFWQDGVNFLLCSALVYFLLVIVCGIAAAIFYESHFTRDGTQIPSRRFGNIWRSGVQSEPTSK